MTATGTAIGSKTEEGKQRPKIDAFKHGLTGQTLLLTPEETALYDHPSNTWLHNEKALSNVATNGTR
jgi:hypothetical protein